MRPVKILTVEKARSIIEKEMDLEYGEEMDLEYGEEMDLENGEEMDLENGEEMDLENGEEMDLENGEEMDLEHEEVCDTTEPFLDLRLKGFKYIDDDAAKLIGEFAYAVSLPNLISISPRAAAYLAEHRFYLELDGLQHLTEQVARSLCKCEYDLSLSGLTCISERVASILAKRFTGLRDCALCLDGLVELPDAVAKKLSRFFANLTLNGLKSISPISARYLSQGSSIHLHLNSLTNLTGGMNDDVAFWLGQARMELSLNGIKVLPASIAKYFQQGEHGIEFGGLTELPDEVAELLVQRQGSIYLSGLTALRETTAKILSTHQGWLELGVTTLSPEIAKQLSESSGSLAFWKLETLEEDTAQALVGHAGYLEVAGLKSISPRAAEIICQHKGELHVNLNWLPLQVREILSKRNKTCSCKTCNREKASPEEPTEYPFSAN